MNTKLLALVAVFVIGILSVIFLSGQGTNPAPVNTTQDSGSSSSAKSSVTVSSTPQMSEYNQDELAMHNTQEDCWTVVDGTVYDLTGFIAKGKHPMDIVKACGTDGSVLFQTRGDKNSPHPASAAETLSSLEVGKLVK